MTKINRTLINEKYSLKLEIQQMGFKDEKQFKSELLEDRPAQIIPHAG